VVNALCIKLEEERVDHVWIFTTDVPEDKLQLLTFKLTDVGDTPSKLASQV